MSDIRYLLHGITLALAWFLLLNAAATALVAIVFRRLTSDDTAAAPGFWLALRLFPAALSVGFVAIVFLPSYWQYEPRESVEGFDVSLSALAIAAVAVIMAASARGLSAWRQASRRAAAWLRTSRPLTLSDGSMPAFAVESDAPVMALVGVLRPRLLIARPVLEALTGEELRAAVAHEIGHWHAWDNLKRLAMRTAPDFLAAGGVARAIEGRWASASEHVADRAAGDNGLARCALASALVKVARLTPPATPLAEPISTLVDGGDITSRVHCLLGDAAPRVRSSRRWPIAIASAAAAVACYGPLLRIVHAATEVLVHTLP
jgi:Zn-dependent protease with chaperone function